MKKTVKLINPKFFTECVDDVEYVVPICNEVNKAIEKEVEKMILDSTLKDGEMRIYKDLHNGWVEEEETVNIQTLSRWQDPTIKEYKKEIERLNGVINEIEAVVYADISNIDCRITIQEILDKAKEVKKDEI